MYWPIGLLVGFHGLTCPLNSSNQWEFGTSMNPSSKERCVPYGLIFVIYPIMMSNSKTAGKKTHQNTLVEDHHF
jgi:hypothetical protein